MVKVAVGLSGCGVYDGAEIYESVIVLLALDRAGAEVQCFAPDKPQLHVFDHLRGEVAEGEERNVLVESARTARGEIVPATEIRAEDFDALILPGGFGAAKNLSDFALKGAEARADEEVARVIREFLDAGRPLGAICMAPAVVAAALRDSGRKVELTIGRDAEVAEALEAMGAKHVACPVRDVHIDEANDVVTTPAYMLAGSISEAADGIEKLVRKILERCGAGLTPAG